MTIEKYMFYSFSSDNSEYAFASVVVPEPQLSGAVYSGGEIEGYVAFLVDESDPAPKCVFERNFDGTGGTSGRNGPSGLV